MPFTFLALILSQAVVPHLWKVASKVCALSSLHVCHLDGGNGIVCIESSLLSSSHRWSFSQFVSSSLFSFKSFAFLVGSETKRKNDL